MRVKVCSAFDEKDLEYAIQKAIATAEDSGFYLDDIKYSTAYHENKQEILHSALLIFEQDEDDYDYYEE